MDEQPAKQALLAALIRKQAGLSDRKFAAVLGVDVGQWNRVRRSVWPVTERMVDAITARCPELAPELALFLKERATMRNAKRANIPQEGQP